MTRQEFAKGMLLLQSGISREFTRQTMEVWFGVLQDLNKNEFDYAIARYLAESTSAFPMPAQLRGYADEFSHQQPMNFSDAFAVVMKAVREFGSYQSNLAMSKLDPITRAAVNGCGGFQWFCDLEADQRHNAIAQFRNAYQAAQQSHLRDRRLPEQLRPAIANQNQRISNRDNDGLLSLGNVIENIN